MQQLAQRNHSRKSIKQTMSEEFKAIWELLKGTGGWLVAAIFALTSLTGKVLVDRRRVIADETNQKSTVTLEHDKTLLHGLHESMTLFTTVFRDETTRIQADFNLRFIEAKTDFKAELLAVKDEFEKKSIEADFAYKELSHNMNQMALDHKTEMSQVVLKHKDELHNLEVRHQKELYEERLKNQQLTDQINNLRKEIETFRAMPQFSGVERRGKDTSDA